MTGRLHLAWIGGPFPEPGMRLAVDVPPGFTGFGDRPYVLGQGFTLSIGSVRWRAMLVSQAGRPDGGTRLEVEIVGRYPGDEAAGQVSQA